MKKITLFIIFLLKASINLASELKEVSADQFIAEASSLERMAITDFIIHQFDDKRKKGVSQVMLDSLWNDIKARQALNMIRFQIVNQELYVDSFSLEHYYFKPLLVYFQNFVKKYKIKDVDFIIYAHDIIPPNNQYSQKTIGIPAFMMSKNINSVYEKDKLLMPDEYMIDKEKWAPLITQIEKANSNILWEEKEDKVFWRGGSHGAENKNYYNITNFSKLARLKIVMFSKLYPNLIDAEFASYGEFSKDQDGNNLRHILDLLFGSKRKRVKEIDHLKYKYLIAIDGNTCPWLRVPWISLSNSLLLKQESNYMEWFYVALKPYTHYIPIKNDLTDIFEKIEWLKANDLQAKEISINAQNFIRNNLLPEHIDTHMALILTEYSSIQKDDQIIPTLPKAEEVIKKINDIEIKKNNSLKAFSKKYLSL